MSDLLTRAASLFVTPATPASPAAGRVAAEPPSRFAPRALVLGSRRSAPALAAALAAELRRPSRWPAAIVAVWAEAAGNPGSYDDQEWDSGAVWTPAEEVPVAPSATGAAASRLPRGTMAATPAARRLSARLVARGLEARARGRLAWIDLPADVAHAQAAAERAAGLDVPMAVAIAGPRPAALEPLLREQDLIVLAASAAGAPVAELVLAELASGGPPVVVLDPPSGAARRLALGGRGRLRAAGMPLATGLGART